MDNDMRISVMDIKGEVGFDIYKGNFPEKLVDLIFEKTKSQEKENLALGRLNTVIKGVLPNCYTNYVNKNNIDSGWIYSFSKEDEPLIKHFLSSWVSEYELDPKEVEKCLDEFRLELVRVDVSLDDLKRPDLLKKNLFLFNISRTLSEKLKYNLLLSSGEFREMNFSFVNEQNRNWKHRLMSDVIEGSVKKGKATYKKVYYSYYVDLAVDSLLEEDTPKLFINVGIVRFRAVESKFNTKKKDIHPYILIDKSAVLEDGKRNYLKGRIVCKNPNFEKNFKPHWDYFFKECFSYTYENLPEIQDIFENPVDYITSDKIKVLIPHGTHFKDAKHDMLQGADVFLRAELSTNVKDVLVDTMGDVFDSNFSSVFVREGRKQGENSIKILENPTLPLNEKGELEIEIYYLHEEFKTIFEEFVDRYNSGILNVKVPKPKECSKDDDNLIKKLLKDKSDSIVTASQSLLKVFQNKDFSKAISKEIPSGFPMEDIASFINELNPSIDVKYKINAKYYSLINDLKISSEIHDGYSIAKNKESKQKALKDINVALAKNNKMITKNIKKTNNVVPAIVEIMDKKYYSKGHLVDLKPSLRNSFAKNKRVTQFCVEMAKKDKNGNTHSSVYNKISKCILDSLRAMGVVTFDADGLLKKHNESDNTALMGLYGVPSSEKFILTSVYNGQVYGYVVGMSNKWLPLSEMLIEMGSVVEYDFEVRQDSIEIAIRKFKDEYSPSHIIIMANRTTLRRKVPYFIKMEDNFNLCVKYRELESFEALPMDKTIGDIISLVTLDEESGGLCPEWVVKDNGSENPTSLIGRFFKLNDSVYCGTAKKTNSSKMSGLVNKRKEEALDSIFRKETAILYSVPRVKESWDKEFVARLVHSLREEASIQSMDEHTAYPYPLHVAKKSSEYMFNSKTDLFYSKEDIEDMSLEDELILSSVVLDNDLDLDEKEDRYEYFVEQIGFFS